MILKPAIALSALILATGHAVAQTALCAGLPTLKPAEIGVLFQGAGQYTCGSLGDETWDELHAGTGSSGNIIDYKKGPTDPIDPSKTVGTYTVTSMTTPSGAIGILTDRYGGGHEYSYTISHSSGTSYNYCGMNGAPAQLSITIQPTHCY